MKEIAFITMAVLAMSGWVAFCIIHLLWKDTIRRWKRDSKLLMIGEYDVRNLVSNVVKFARPKTPGQHFRWSIVSEIFGIGSTGGNELCEEFGVDRDEMLSGQYCEECPREPCPCGSEKMYSECCGEE